MNYVRVAAMGELVDLRVVTARVENYPLQIDCVCRQRFYNERTRYPPAAVVISAVSRSFNAASRASVIRETKPKSQARSSTARFSSVTCQNGLY